MAIVCGLALVPKSGRGADAVTPVADAPDAQAAALPPNRNEFLPIPEIGGNSDIGVELGASLTF